MEQERSVRCEVALGPGKCSDDRDDPAAVIDNVQVLGYAVGLAQHPEPRVHVCQANLPVFIEPGRFLVERAVKRAVEAHRHAAKILFLAGVRNLKAPVWRPAARLSRRERE